MLERQVKYTTPKHVETILRTLEARPAGTDRWRARCLAHGGESTGTLSIALGTDNRILVHCFSGCTVPEILAASGLTWADVFGSPRRRPSLAQAAEAGSNRIFDANMKRARLIAPGALWKLNELIGKTSRFIQTAAALGIEAPALLTRLGTLILKREDLERELEALDGRDPIEAIVALLRIRQRGQDAA